MKSQPKDFWLGFMRARASRMQKKKINIFKYYFIYFTNLFYNLSNILIFIFTYNLIK